MKWTLWWQEINIANLELRSLCSEGVRCSIFLRRNADNTCYLNVILVGNKTFLFYYRSYLLGLLAMIKCSICSYQCDNWYVSNWRLDCHIYFCWGNAVLSLLRSFHVLHQNCTLSGRSPPFGVTVSPDPRSMMECMCQTFWLGNANHNCWNVFGACSRVRVYSRHCQGEMGAFQKRQIRTPILRSSFTHLSPFSRKLPRNVHFSCNCSEWFGWLVLGAFLWGNYFLYILKCA